MSSLFPPVLDVPFARGPSCLPIKLKHRHNHTLSILSQFPPVCYDVPSSLCVSFFLSVGLCLPFFFSFFFFLSHLCFLSQTDTQTYCFQFTEGSSPEENLGVEQTQQQGPPSIKHGTSNTMMTSEREINTVWMSERAQRRTNKWWIQWLRLSAPAALSSGLPPL